MRRIQGVVQQDGCAHHLQVGALCQGDALCELIDAQDVVKAMHGIRLRVPETGGFKAEHVPGLY
jgi:hypothetical protein